ncbi:MAG: hypothetical protein QOD68_1974 [Actinomycetota bacterium]|jgi:hypothetical protein|nr:hypothetical protein [Actinomycetota bacterium]
MISGVRGSSGATATADARLRSRIGLLLIALALDLLVTLWLEQDGVDRANGLNPDPDPGKLWYGVVFGWPAVVALLLCALPGRGPRVACLVLGVVGLVLALLGLAVYGLGLFYLVPAGVAFAAGVITSREPVDPAHVGSVR